MYFVWLYWQSSKIAGSMEGWSMCSPDLSCQVVCLGGALQGPYRETVPKPGCVILHLEGDLHSSVFWGFFSDILQLLLELESVGVFLSPVLVGLAACSCNFQFVSRLMFLCLSWLLGAGEKRHTWSCSHTENICLLRSSSTKQWQRMVLSSIGV